MVDICRRHRHILVGTRRLQRSLAQRAGGMRARCWKHMPLPLHPFTASATRVSTLLTKHSASDVTPKGCRAAFYRCSPKYTAHRTRLACRLLQSVWHLCKHESTYTDRHSKSAQTYCLKCSAASGGKGGPAVIDLHGQHVAEAIKLLRRELSRLRRAAGGQNRQSADQAQAGAGRSQRIQILVGNNHHSKVNS